METVSGTPEYHSTTKRPTRDTLVLGLAFLAVFTSFQSLQNLQSSLHQDHGLGVASLAVLYGCTFLISFITPAIVYHIGAKSTVMLAWVGHCLYVASNVYPHWATLLPGSVLLGILSVPLWTTNKIYITSWSYVLVEHEHERHRKEKEGRAHTRQTDSGRGLERQGKAPELERQGQRPGVKRPEQSEEEGSVELRQEGHNFEESQEKGRGQGNQEKEQDQENEDRRQGLERQETGWGIERQRDNKGGRMVMRSLHHPPITFHAAFSRLNGLFTAVFHLSQLTGNFVSSVILFQSSYLQEPETSYPSTTTCGAKYCPREGEGRRLAPPQPYIVYILLSVFFVLDLIGLGITWRFLPDLEQPRYTGKDVLRKLRSYWVTFCQPKLWLLIPLFLSQATTFSLIVTLFTEAYVSCALGIRMVGYVMAVWGLTSVASSALLGYVARFTGRQFLFGVAYLGDAAVLLLLLYWRPHSGSLPVLLCVAVARGVVDAIWAVQGSALIAVLFPTTVDSAFSCSATWHDLAMTASLGLGSHICPPTRLYLALGLLASSVLGYVAVEILHQRGLRSFSRGEQAYALLSTSSTGDDDAAEGHFVGEESEQETVFMKAVSKRGAGYAHRGAIRATDGDGSNGDIITDVGGDVMVDGSCGNRAFGADDIMVYDSNEFGDTDILIDKSQSDGRRW